MNRTEAIRQHLKTGPKTMRELAIAAGFNPAETSLTHSLMANDLRKGRIERIFGTKPIQYRLVDLKRQQIAQHVAALEKLGCKVSITMEAT